MVVISRKDFDVLVTETGYNIINFVKHFLSSISGTRS